jgi:non-ribosomal peptide synthetase component F
MNELHRLLEQLHGQGIEVYAEGEQIHCRAAQDKLDDGVLTALRQHQDILRTYLQAHTLGPLLPSDHARAPGRPPRLENMPWHLSADLHTALKTLAQSAGVDSNTLFASAFAALLGRYSQRHQFALGVAEGRLDIRLNDELDFLDLCAQLQTPPLPVLHPCRIWYGTSAPKDFELALLPANTYQGLWRFDAHLFEFATIARLNAHWQNLLAQVARNPYQRLVLIQILSLPERRTMLRDWNKTQSTTIPSLWQHLSTLDGDAALRGTQRLSYAELRARAQSLAAYLSQQDAGALIGVYSEDMLEVLPACLAILLAGCTCVPLNHPHDLISLDKPPLFILTHSSCRHLFAPDTPLIYLDAAPQMPGNSIIDQSGAAWLVEKITFSERALTRQLAWQGRAQNGRALLRAAPGSALFLQQLLSAWGSGDTLVCADVGDNPTALLHGMVTYALEKVFLSARELNGVAEQALRQQYWPSSLRLIILDNNRPALTPALCAWFSHLPDCALQLRCTPPSALTVASHDFFPLSSSKITVGKALPGTYLYILDRHHQPMPIGVHGELYVAGSAVGTGAALPYERLALHNQQLVIMDAAQNPLLTETCMLLNCLRTGLSARYLEDGSVELL